ncbi:myb-like protein D [Aphis craccivora]|uniref:Myb-like protein D n=1 Tax=Aphis craccivora TaxID=307492 RepID=A0A6G0WT65_APHCR|nr:myb-like protein D [Aphis craccivora]
MAVNLVEEKFAPTLVKYITTRLCGRALEMIKYKNVTKWVQLNSIKMCNDEDVNDYYHRVKKLYYKLCTACTLNKEESEARFTSGGSSYSSSSAFRQFGNKPRGFTVPVSLRHRHHLLPPNIIFSLGCISRPGDWPSLVSPLFVILLFKKELRLRTVPVWVLVVDADRFLRSTCGETNILML